MFIHLPEGMRAADYTAAVAGGESFPPGALDCSGPGLTSPGETLDMWVELDPGRYILACWFRHLDATGDYALHVASASSHELIVGPVVQDDRLPVEDAVIRLVDFRFELLGELVAGERTLRVEQAGPSMHEMDVYRMHEGRNLEDLKSWYASGRRVPPPATALGGVLDSHTEGRTVWLRRHFAPGLHVAWCGMDMPTDPAMPPVKHADVGMRLEFVVAE